MIEIFDCEQGGPEWLALRAGLPTASCFADILSKGVKGAPSLTRKKYMNRLAAEIVTGAPLESYTNPFMERGKAQEAQARSMYILTTGATDVRLVGFVRNGNRGCSPDSLQGEKGMLEIKTQRADLLIETLDKDEFPPEHVAQVQGGLWVAEREWADIAIFAPGMPLFVKRAHRDEPYIKTLAEEVDRFVAEVAKVVERVRARL